MKNKFLNIIFFFSIFQCFAQEYFYYTPRGKEYLGKVSKNEIFVKFSDKVSKGKKVQIIQKINKKYKNGTSYKIDNEISNMGRKNFGNRIKLNKVQQLNEINEIIDKFLQFDEVVSVSPIFVDWRGGIACYTNEFLVKLKKSTPYNIFINLLSENNVEIIESNGLSYTLKANSKEKTVLQLSNLFYETGYFEHCEPNLIQTIHYH